MLQSGSELTYSNSEYGSREGSDSTELKRTHDQHQSAECEIPSKPYSATESKRTKQSDTTKENSLAALREENERLKSDARCKVCMNQTSIILFLPCGHLITCVDCAASVKLCPLCRSEVKTFIKTTM